MMRDRAFIFFEGDKDTDFFYAVLYPLFKKKYRMVKTIKYSKEKNEDIQNFIKQAKDMGNCIFVHDLDDYPCVRNIKKEIGTTWKELEDNEIHIVQKEIESWYLVGLNLTIANKVGIGNNFTQTNDICKGDFLSLRPDKMTKMTFYSIFLNDFDLNKATERNKSLKRFIEKCLSI